MSFMFYCIYKALKLPFCKRNVLYRTDGIYTVMGGTPLTTLFAWRKYLLKSFRECWFVFNYFSMKLIDVVLLDSCRESLTSNEHFSSLSKIFHNQYI